MSDQADTSLADLIGQHIAAGKQGRLELKDRAFSGPQSLKELTLDFELDLERASFPDGLEVQFCTFMKTLSVSDARFGGRRADFADCVFRGIAVLRPLQVSLVSVRSSTFLAGLEIALPRDASAHVDLRWAVIGGTAVVCPLDYGQALAEGPVNVRSVEASGLIVSKESSLELSGFTTKKLQLSEMVLQDKASVFLSEVQAETLYFNDVRQVDKANVGFNRVNLEGARFSGSNVERYSFMNVTWPRGDNRVVLLEEAQWRLGKVDDKSADAHKLSDVAERVIENYRQLVLNFEGRRNYELAELFHTSEMEILRHRAGARLPQALGRMRFELNAYGLYRALSGYGANYPRAAAVLLVMLIFFSGAFLLSGMTPKGGHYFDYDLLPSVSHPPVEQAVLGEDSLKALALTLTIVTLQKDRPAELDGTYGALLASLLLILVPAQAALFLFALRRRFRRASI